MVWRAARATGAAPSYFRAFGRFLDGGLIANNPTLDAMTEIHEYNMALRSAGRETEAVPVSAVVSLGTGHIPVTELKDIDVFRPESIWDTAKLAYGISTIGKFRINMKVIYTIMGVFNLLQVICLWIKPPALMAASLIVLVPGAAPLAYPTTDLIHS